MSGLSPTGDNPDPKHQEAVLRIRDACQRHGVAPGVHTGSSEYTTKWLDAGFQMVNLGADVGFMRGLAATELTAARSQTGVRPVQDD